MIFLIIKKLILATILIISFVFISIFSAGNTYATYDSDECIDHYGWYWVGPEYWGDPCGTPWQAGNYCCNSGSSTTSDPKGSNVCNDKFRCTVSEEGWCTHGPYASSSEVKHDCRWNGSSCSVCSSGETQTETTESLSCTSNPSDCNGYSGRCDQSVAVKERSRTCNYDCGGWSGWSDWYTVREYPQCPADPRIDCGNCSVPSSCGDGSCNNGETCSSCRTDCGSCPPNARYRCIGSRCERDDAGGTTTNPSCGGLCSAPPPGCPNATVSVSPNPVNVNSPVTFSATSSYGYANANISHGGGAQGGDDFSITGTYTWRWVYDPPGGKWGNSSSTAGNYNATFSGNRPGGGSSCTFSTPYTVQSTIGRVIGRVYVDRNGNQGWDSASEEFIKTGLPSDGSCSPSNLNFFMKDLQISYTGPVIWANSVNGCNNQPGYGSAPFYDTNQIPIGTYTFRPTGILTGWRMPNPQTFTLASGETKNLWWGLNPPPVPLTPTLPSCSDTPYSVTLNWQNTAPANALAVDIDDGNWDNGYYNKTLTTGFQYSTQAPDGFRWRRPEDGVLTTPMPQFQPNTNYFWRIFNGEVHTNGPSWNVPLCQKAWIQIDGDVHSNERIRVP